MRLKGRHRRGVVDVVEREVSRGRSTTAAGAYAGEALNGHEAGNGGYSQGWTSTDEAGPREGPNEEESVTLTECGKAMHQMSAKAELAREGRGEASEYRAVVKPDEQA